MVDVLSNIYRTLPVLAARLGGFEPRRPRDCLFPIGYDRKFKSACDAIFLLAADNISFILRFDRFRGKISGAFPASGSDSEARKRA